MCSHCGTGEDFELQIEHIMCKRLSSQVVFLSFPQAIWTFAKLGPLTCRQLFRPGISLSPYLSASPPPLGEHHDCGGVGAAMDACANPSPQHGGGTSQECPIPSLQVQSAVVWSPVLIDGDRLTCPHCFQIQSVAVWSPVLTDGDGH